MIKLKIQTIFQTTKKKFLILFGKQLEVKVNKTNEKFNIRLQEDKIFVSIPVTSKNKEVLYIYLKYWIEKNLREILRRYLNEFQLKMGVSINKVYIKKQKTRWASYSTKKNLNFNIKITALSKKIIQYIVIHELAHSFELNHSKNFWSIIKKYCPEYKQMKRKLKVEQSEIIKNDFWNRILKV